jgi:hypothetical protein
VSVQDVLRGFRWGEAIEISSWMQIVCSRHVLVVVVVVVSRDGRTHSEQSRDREEGDESDHDRDEQR